MRHCVSAHFRYLYLSQSTGCSAARWRSCRTSGPQVADTACANILLFRCCSCGLSLCRTLTPTPWTGNILLIDSLNLSLTVVHCRRGVVVSGVRRMNEVNPPRARLWMGDRLQAGIPSRYITSQLGHISLASLRGRLIEYQLRLG